jgi:hypothetical protein
MQRTLIQDTSPTSLPTITNLLIQPSHTPVFLYVVVPASTDMHKLVRQLTDSGWFYLEDGVLFVKPSSSGPRPLKLDILTKIIDNKTFDDLIRHTAIIGGNTVLTLSMSLGVKLRCWYLRQDDENGLSKKRSDLLDVQLLRKSLSPKRANFTRPY